jgi:isopentenyl phosphate kinase
VETIAPNTIFLKLGGSLITDKMQPRVARLEVLHRLAGEIAQARIEKPGIKIILGHGSGSFGHVPAKKHHTRDGVHTPQDWLGFVEVWKEATALDRIVIDALHQAGLPAVAFPASSSLTTENRQVLNWNLNPLQMALEAGLLPVIFGDVIFDRQMGGTIFSTEDLFFHLAYLLPPGRILIAGMEPGVWKDYPACTHLFEQITPDTDLGSATLLGSAAPDVTGGMFSKVRLMLSLVTDMPGLQVRIFSGLQEGQVYQALLGESVGTLILTR